MEERMDFRILNNGSFIPSIGYGTYKTGTEGETEQAVANALGVGYRLLWQRGLPAHGLWKEESA